MGIMESLRKAEEQSRQAARRSGEKARAAWDETERALRRKMRIRPPSKPGDGDATPRNVSVQPTTERNPIVSVNGRDLTPEELREKKIA